MRSKLMNYSYSRSLRDVVRRSIPGYPGVFTRSLRRLAPRYDVFKTLRPLFVIGFTLIVCSIVVLGQTKPPTERQPKRPKITFVELGSVNCIPCKKMQPVMKAIEQKYGENVSVIFYDVWTDEQKPYARKYNIRLIPTQVFLDENGKEFFRHEGFFPEEEIHKIFKLRGVTPTQTGG